jgi:energy-coupling factor transporter ATP-binding protein EcfA2
MSLSQSSVEGAGTEAAGFEAAAAQTSGIRPRIRLSARLAASELPTAPVPGRPVAVERQVVFQARNVSVNYGEKRAIDAVTMDINRNFATALIGPSGCGKSTFLRCLNRMNDSIAGFSLGGQLLYHGHDLYDARANRVEVRRRIGMVFQKPNPFPKSIYDNIAWAARNLGMRDGMDERVEQALRGAALWDEVKDRLKSSALGLSGGQQQRLCIARSIAIEPDVFVGYLACGFPAARAGAPPRPDRDRLNRGPDPRAKSALHDRDRHAQHAAGHARGRQDRLLQPR